MFWPVQNCRLSHLAVISKPDKTPTAMPSSTSRACL